MVVLENRLFLNGVVYAVLHLVGRFFRLEVHKTACVFPVFQQMNNGIGRPLTFIAGVVAAYAACALVFQRSRRGDFLLGQHTGYLGRTVPGKAKLVNLLDYRGGFLVNDEIFVLVHEVAVHGLAGNRLTAHAFCFLNCLDFFARISHHPFVEKITQRGKIVVAHCAVHSVIDSDKADAFLWEKHFCVHSHLEIISP